MFLPLSDPCRVIASPHIFDLLQWLPVMVLSSVPPGHEIGAVVHVRPTQPVWRRRLLQITGCVMAVTLVWKAGCKLFRHEVCGVGVVPRTMPPPPPPASAALQIG